ncbi:hypothetical protein ACFQX6_31340 [Streptosporangium lutulentum]
MDFRVLGPVEVIADDGTPLDIGPYQQRAVLAMCMLIAPRPAGPSQMIDALWEGSRLRERSTPSRPTSPSSAAPSSPAGGGTCPRRSWSPGPAATPSTSPRPHWTWAG